MLVVLLSLVLGSEAVIFRLSVFRQQKQPQLLALAFKLASGPGKDDGFRMAVSGAVALKKALSYIHVKTYTYICIYIYM